MKTATQTILKKSSISVFTMSMLTVAAVMSLRNLPSQAEYGYSIIFYMIAASVCFFVPSALVSAELASTYPQDGGVYLWVKQAFGPKWGFVAIFMQWVENLPWFPAVLTFVASSIAYVFNPALATNRWFVFITILVTLWLATWLNFRGMKLSAFLSSSGALAGTVVPGVVIILMAVGFLVAGNAPEITLSWDSLVPSLDNMNQLMLLSGMMVALSGMEMSSIHVTEMDNPTVRFPKAILWAAAVVILLSIFGSLAISLVIPPAAISLAAGADQAFAKMFEIFHIPWMTPVMCFLLAYGAITMVVTWVLGPSKGVLEVAREGYLPAYWQARNKHGMPVRILVVQAVISSLLATVVLFMPTISGAFWIMSALTAQLYMIMYLFMFAAAIRLRYTQPDVPRPYKVPGGKFGMWCVSGIAFLTSILAIFVGFIPTPGVRAKGIEDELIYIGFLFFGSLFFMAIPILLYHLYEKRHRAAVASATEQAAK
ncbi:MAG: amino acid permease [Victivallaceae bacterium]|nr:amino acid permease [Victivallaceae bacterium]